MGEKLLSKEQQLYFQIIDDLHKNWQPHPGQLEVGKRFFQDNLTTVFLQCGRKFGKCLESLTFIRTPSGKTRIKDLNPGDIIFDRFGKETKVLNVSDIYTDNPCYKIEFSDRTSLVADGDHKWVVGHRTEPKERIFTTDELIKNRFKSGWNRIPLCEPVEYSKKELPIDPYVFGFWLGDGSSKSGEFYTDDYAIVEEIERRGYVVTHSSIKNVYYIKGIHKKLKELGVYKNKNIPDIYKYADPKQRTELVQGLMDADGWAKRNGRGVGFVQKNQNIFFGLVDILRSLGNHVTICKDKVVDGKIYKELYCPPRTQVFKLKRKAILIQNRLLDDKRQFKRIQSIELIPSVDVKCLEVDSPSHTYLTEDYTVTHNTEFAIYLLWRHALLNPGSACYYVTPEMAHGRKLVWTDPRLSNFGSQKYVKAINSNEMIIKFKNGSFIQVIGSENYAAANGLRPGFLVYDEFCEFNHRFHETMQPNRIVFNCPLIIIGTPPMQDSRNKQQYIDFADECKQRDDAIWIQKSSYENPFIPKKELDMEKEKLLARGEEYLWYSQYEARITAGGRHVIFPMFNKERHVAKHSDIIAEIGRDIHKLEWYCIADPGTTTVMAFLFIALNPYTKRIYVLDEIYEKNSKNTSVRAVFPKVLDKVKSLNNISSFEDDWLKIYDEAAAWFANEVSSQYGYYFMPTLKAHNKRENGVSLLKDCFIHNVITISDRCENLAWEIEQYVADDKGNLPKLHDHVIDCMRYFLAAAHYSMVEIMEAVRNLGPRIPGDEKRGDGNQKWDDPWGEDDWTSVFD